MNLSFMVISSSAVFLRMHYLQPHPRHSILKHFGSYLEEISIYFVFKPSPKCLKTNWQLDTFQEACVWAVCSGVLRCALTGSFKVSSSSQPRLFVCFKKHFCGALASHRTSVCRFAIGTCCEVANLYFPLQVLDFNNPGGSHTLCMLDKCSFTELHPSLRLLVVLMCL